MYPNKEELINYYIIQNLSQKEIASIFKISQSKICVLLKKFNIKKIKPSKEDFEKDLKILTREQVAKKYGYSSICSLNNKLKKLEVKCLKNNLLKHDYFKTWSSNMAYILGFVAADGSIHCKRPYLTIELQERDSYILSFIKKELNHNGNILCYNHKDKRSGKNYISKKISLYSEIIKNDLRDLGLLPNKTKHGIFINVKKIPEEYFYDFFRGWFDGDGSLTKRISKWNKVYIRIKITCSDKNFLEKVKERINLLSSIDSSEINYHNLIYDHYSSIELYKKMYKENCICLIRKKEKFEEILKND